MSQARLESHVTEAAFDEPGDEMAVRPDGAAGRAAAIPHLVIKRGHLGRYRFAFFGQDGRLTGEVRITDRDADRAEQEVDARAEIKKIVAALMAAIE